MHAHPSQVMLTAALLLLGAALPAQECDDFNVCTASDTCFDELCVGTVVPGAACEEDCLINTRCTEDGFCDGDPAPDGTPCAHGCGTCQGLLCVAEPARMDEPCDPGLGTPCIVGTCRDFGIAICLPSGLRQCDDTDGDPCTDNCDLLTGECRRDAPRCLFADCETCNPETGECQPFNIGGPCDDFDLCTPESHCELAPAESLPLASAFCAAGPPTIDTPTPTPPGEATPTGPPIGGCVGDCNRDGVVAVNELVVGVNIALGNQVIDACPLFDLNRNGRVEVNELISGVNALLNGCPI